MGERIDNQDTGLRIGDDAQSEPLNPLDLLEGSVSERDFVCDQLEAIADDLPNRVDINQTLSAAQFLKLRLPAYHRDERECLFPLLKRRAPRSMGMNRIVLQLQTFQIDDEDYALEIVETLESLADDPAVGNPDAIGYMLRGFFQSYRRYLAWQRLTILPLAGSLLREAELEELSAAIRWCRRSAGSPAIYLLHGKS